MKTSKSNTVKILIGLLAPAFFANCGQSPTSAAGREPEQERNATVQSTVVLGKVGALGKSSAINLCKLVLTAVSTANPPDTVRDTSSVGGNAQVTVLRNLTLAPLRTWVVTAKSLDVKDSVIHSGSSAAFFVKPADTAAVTLNLTSRFAMYEARFNALPDSIGSSTSGTGKDKLNLNRVVLLVDGVVKADSVLASGFFSANQSVNVFWDYITPGSHTVTLEAYGVLHTYSGKLYSGSSTFSVSAGTDDTQAVTLAWAGPATGTGKLTVTLGKVGKVVINGGLPGTVLN
ncbi:MAG TPA: hypothetical protein VJ385_12510 [Fibrobacteria bacterium]|nr:hypothetical protein [Fibrobacteria bacterium]